MGGLANLRVEDGLQARVPARIGGAVNVNEAVDNRDEADDALPPGLSVVEEPLNLVGAPRLHFGNVIRVGLVALIPYVTLPEETRLAFGDIHGIRIPSIIATKVGVGFYCEGVCPFKKDNAFSESFDKPGTMLHFLYLGVDRSVDIITAILRVHAYVTQSGVVSQKPVRVDAGDDHFVFDRHLSGVFLFAKTSAPQPGKPAMTKTEMLSGMGKIDVHA